MGQDTKIEWADHTFNPWWGCEKIAPECAHCYAETFAKRTGNAVWGAAAPRRFFGDKHWNEPLAWNVAAGLDGKKRRVFCASMADVFEDRRDLDEARERMWELIERTPNLIWMLLTKRPENWEKLTPASWAAGAPSNVWAMTTAGCQETADKNVPALLRIKARVRGVSCEPMLGRVELAKYFHHRDTEAQRRIDWVIVGGESGHGARPMHPDWAQEVRDQCVDAGVKFFFKQWGEWAEWEPKYDVRSVKHVKGDGTLHHEPINAGASGTPMGRVGKKLAGRELDGRTWDEVPE